MSNVKIQVEFPEEVLLSAKIPQQRAGAEITRLAAFEMYREGLISLAKACELAEMSLWEFFDLNRKLAIPLNYDEEEWQKDKEAVQEIAQS